MGRNFRSDRLWLAVAMLAMAGTGADGALAAEDRLGGGWSKPMIADASPRGDVRGTGGRERRPAGYARAGGVLGMFDEPQGRGLAVPVGRDVSFGVDYEYVTPEDLAFELAETGALRSDYESHEVMIRAAWRF